MRRRSASQPLYDSEVGELGQCGYGEPSPVSGRVERPHAITRPLAGLGSPIAYPPQHDLPAAFFADGGTSFAGFSAKKPFGFSMKPMYPVGITG